MEKHFTLWATLTLFSVVSMSALVAIYDKNTTWTREQRWAGSVAFISFIMGAIACFLHLGMKDIFAGKPLELGWVLVVLALWSAVMPTILEARNNSHFSFALAPGGQVVEANLFFGSWGAFIMAFMLTTSHIKAFFKWDDRKYFFRWCGFALASLVVLWSTAHLWKNECDGSTDTEYCKRTMFGLVLSAISLCAGLILALLPVMMIVQQVMALLFFAAWCVSVGYVTYGVSGPGTPIGSLYFASWICLFMSFLVLAPEILARYEALMNQNETVTEGDNADGTATKMEEGQAVADAKAHDGDNEEEEVAPQSA